MSTQAQTFGPFVDEEHDLEFLIINFSPSSIPLQQRWRNSGLSADFLGDYWSVFFPTSEGTASNRRAEVRNAVSYIANELLENAMKFNYEPARCPITISLHLYDSQLRFYVSNCIDPASVFAFQEFITRLLSEDSADLYMEQLERSAEEESESSRLGYLTMLNDYQADLAWKFAPSPDCADAIVLTTMVQLSV